MSLYFWIIISIVSIPLLLSFERRISYFKKWPNVFSSIFLVGSFYVAWDMIATWVKDWSFNSAYVGSFKIVNLPIEEVLFFVVVPFSCIFIYEVICYFSKKNDDVEYNKNIIYIFIVFLMALALRFQDQSYTAMSLILLAGFFFLSVNFFKGIVFKKNFFAYILICYAPFLVFNGILTGIPVVSYNSASIWGARILSIPVEDFIYNFTFLGFSLIVYEMMTRRKAL